MYFNRIDISFSLNKEDVFIVKISKCYWQYCGFFVFFLFIRKEAIKSNQHDKCAQAEDRFMKTFLCCDPQRQDWDV